MKKILLFFSLLAIAYGLCFAQTAWQTDGIPVCTATADQQYPVIVPDQKGGGIIIWQDYRAGNWDLYAQRVDSAGNRLWANNGVVIATGTQDQRAPKAISDMRGGAIVVYNRMDGSIWYDIWAQRVDSAGNPCWGANGIDVSSLTNSIQMSYRLCSDSAGGALITWQNNDTLSSDGNDGYIQRVDSTGNLPWGTAGMLVAGGPGEQRCVGGVVTDSRGGGVIFWDKVLPGLDFRFYVSRINKDGIFKWQSATVCTLSGEKYIWNTITDGSGGGIAVWKDKRSGSWDIYTQRVDSSGNVLWQLNGVPVCTAAGTQDNPVIIADGLGGGVISWHDFRGTYADIYVQRVDSAGTAQWTENGTAICTYDSGQGWPCITLTDTGKTVISWFDYRNGPYNIYAQAIDGDGSLAWTASGLAVCTATGGQFNDIYNRQNQIITADNKGGVILTWHDGRNGNNDIYAQKLRGLINGVEGGPDGRGLIYQARLKVYPNPFRVFAQVAGVKQGEEITVYDITGRLVEKTMGSVIGKKLSAGVYFVTAVKYKVVKALKIK